MKKILVTGSTGFIGKALVSFLASKGCDVTELIRFADPSASRSIVWNPETHEAPDGAFDGFDAVIHLAGEPLTLNRWSKEKEDKILHSRVTGTMFLSHLLSSSIAPPKVFISASAVGFYGDRKDEELTESDPSGHSFLSHVCSAWEQASFALQNRGVRTSFMRFGMVLGKGGGAMQKLLSLYRLGLGGKLGSGEQWISWIDREDLLRAAYHILLNHSLEGAVNVVSPNPVRQVIFAKILAKLLKRPHLFSVPSWGLRLMMGKVADELLLSSAKVHPGKLLASNFSFQYPDLEGSLRRAVSSL